jgi:hypothetical protein
VTRGEGSAAICAHPRSSPRSRTKEKKKGSGWGNQLCFDGEPARKSPITEWTIKGKDQGVGGNRKDVKYQRRSANPVRDLLYDQDCEKRAEKDRHQPAGKFHGA